MNTKEESKQQSVEEILQIILDDFTKRVKKMRRLHNADPMDPAITEELHYLDTLANRSIGILQIYRTLTRKS